MDSSRDAPFAVEAAGLRVGSLDLCAASLRYFDPEGSFAAAVLETIGRPIPKPLRAASYNAGSIHAQVILAWRSPTETLLLCSERTVIAEFARRLFSAADGCMVDQSGGVCVIRAQGGRARDLLQRMGATTAIPNLSEACAARFAELPVLTVCVKADEFLLIVERVYADHLMEWIRATAADFN